MLAASMVLRIGGPEDCSSRRIHLASPSASRHTNIFQSFVLSMPAYCFSGRSSSGLTRPLPPTLVSGSHAAMASASINGRAAARSPAAGQAFSCSQA